MTFDKLCEECGIKNPYLGRCDKEAAILAIMNLGKSIKQGGDRADDSGNPIYDMGFWDAHTIIHLLAKAYVNAPLPANVYAGTPLPYPRGAP